MITWTPCVAIFSEVFLLIWIKRPSRLKVTIYPQPPRLSPAFYSRIKILLNKLFQPGPQSKIRFTSGIFYHMNERTSRYDIVVSTSGWCDSLYIFHTLFTLLHHPLSIFIFCLLSLVREHLIPIDPVSEIHTWLIRFGIYSKWVNKQLEQQINKSNLGNWGHRIHFTCFPFLFNLVVQSAQLSGIKTSTGVVKSLFNPYVLTALPSIKNIMRNHIVPFLC